MKLKKMIENGVFISLCCALGYYAFFGHNNLYEYFRRKRGCNIERERIEKINNDIARLKRLESAWKQNPEALEQHARQALCMGHTNELVYMLKA